MHKTKRFLFEFKKTIQNFINVTIFYSVIFFFLGSSYAFAYSNLIVNPGAETDSMAGWTVDNNNGDGWATDWNGPGHSDERVFSTSYDWDTRHQIIDLIDAGYTEEQLDSETFDIKMSEWISTRGDQGGSYYLNFKLLAEDGTTVLDSYERGTLMSPISLASGVSWFQETYTFTDIPIGTRYVYFGDGGKDQSVWAGHYGVNFDDASVVVSDTPFYELSYIEGSNGTLTGTITQTLSSGSNGSSITAVPNSGYAFIDWSDSSTDNPRIDTNVTQNISVTANFSDIISPVISNINVSSITRDSATITWTTDEISSSSLYYGISGYTTTTPEINTLPRVTSHTITLNNLICGTTYSFKAISKDEYNNVSADNNNSFTTSTCPAAAVPLWIVQEQSRLLQLANLPTQQQKVNQTLVNQDPVLENAPLSSGYIFTKNLKMGQTNSDVIELQKFLKDQGDEIYPEGIISGYFGILTKRAVIRFQEKYAEEILYSFINKKGTGIVAENTTKKINSLTKASY